jgi:O-succinylbenzoic acid--CoA ligase
MLDNLFFIRDGEISSNIEKVNSNQDVVAFCAQWIAGQQTFSMHTSGSTGTPKSITISRDQMEASARMTANTLALKAGYNALVCLNTDYIAGKMMLVRGLVNNLNLYVTEPSASPLDMLPVDLNIDFMAVVPLQLESIISAGEQAVNKLNQMKAVIVGGAPVSLTLSLKIQQLSCPVYATYGMTETVSHIALKRLNGDSPSAYFQVLEGVHIGQDDRGCLTINAEVTNHRTITTNDIVKLIDAHTFEWLGRADHIINSGGLKIHPEQLEAQVKTVCMNYQMNDNLIVTGLPDASLGEKLVLIIEADEFSIDSLSALKKSLKEVLPLHQSPKEVYCLKAFIYTPTGKVNRTATTNLISANIR